MQEKTTFPKTGEKKETDIKIAQDYNSLNQAPGDFKNQANAQHDPNIETFFTKYQKRFIYIYQLKRLFANKENNIKFSPNTIKIAFININEVIASVAYETSDYIAQLNQRNTNNVNDNETIFEMEDIKQLIIQQNSLPHNNQPFVISFNEPASETNLNDLYIVNSYVEPLKNPKLRNTKSFLVTKIKDFTANNGYPIVVRIQNQLTSDIIVTGIKIKYPQPCLFGNIKLLGQANGVDGYSKSLLSDDYINFPLLSMPIEVDPKVRLLQWWFSDQILPWELAKQFITEKSVLDLINIEPGTETRKEIIKNARITQAVIATAPTDEAPPLWPINPGLIAQQSGPSGSSHSLGNLTISDNNFFAVSFGAKYPSPNNNYQLVTTSQIFGDIEYEIKDAPMIGSLEIVMLRMLGETYNYYLNFPGILYDSAGNPANGITKLKESFSGQKPEDVITHIYKQWEINNPKYKNDNKVKIFKSIIMMLSKNILSKLSINTGLNDDYKILLPYYFELISSPSEHTNGEPWTFDDCIVVLKSEYFDFSEVDGKIIVKIKNNNLSQNELFQLDENQFNWLSITNELESNAIPSLLPPDWKLSDGEFTKYFTNLIIKKDNIEKALSLYGKLKSNLYSKIELFNIIKDIIIDEFVLNNEIPLKAMTGIEISGIFANGNYNLSLLTSDKNDIEINNLDLFSKNEKISLIKIEI